MKYLFLALFWGTSLLSFSQETIHSKIVDKEGNGIPFATIGIIEKNFGAVTFEDGSFTLAINPAYYEDTLVISAIGHQRRKLAYSQFIKDQPSTLYLAEEVQQLAEVTITQEKLVFSEIGMKKKSSPNHLGISSPLDGLTVAYLVDNVSEQVLVDEIAVVIRQLNMDSIQVRCRIFSVNPETQKPGKDLLSENLIQVATQKQQRLTFQPTKNLWLDEPFFVGFEWVASYS